jgi:hypothetical protein
MPKTTLAGRRSLCDIKWAINLDGMVRKPILDLARNRAYVIVYRERSRSICLVPMRLTQVSRVGRPKSRMAAMEPPDSQTTWWSCLINSTASSLFEKAMAFESGNITGSDASGPRWFFTMGFSTIQVAAKFSALMRKAGPDIGLKIQRHSSSANLSLRSRTSTRSG